MTTHLDAAKENLRTLSESFAEAEPSEEFAISTVATVTLIQATLAVAEQQRVANMQVERGLLFQASGRDVGARGTQAHADAHKLDDRIRAALALEPKED